MRRLTGTLPLAEYLYQTYAVGVETGVKRDAKAIHLPQGTTLADLFRPDFWANYAPPSGPLRVGYLVRVAAQDGAFDLMLRVVAVDRGAVKMQPWPVGHDEAIEVYTRLEDAKALLEPVKVFGKWAPRIDYTKANGWRVIALDGTVHSDGYTGEITAQNALSAYVKKLGYKALGPIPKDEGTPEVEANRPKAAKKEAA
jgi:hypothetical protein